MKKELFHRDSYPMNFVQKLLLTMKLTTALLFIGILHISAIGHSQNARLHLNFKSGTLGDVIEAIENQSDYKIFYKNAQVDTHKSVSVNESEGSVATILNNALNGSNLSYKVMDKVIVLAPAKEIQQKQLSGIVTDAATGEALIGVNVSIEGTTKGVVTDVNGRYALDMPANNAFLIFSYVGYATEKVSVAGQSSINVKLVPEIQKLDEVVVIGYGTQKKSDLTGSVSQVKASDLSATPAASIDGLLKGKSAGLQVMSSTGEPGSGTTIRIRGNNSFFNNGQNNNPLYVVDGLPVGDAGNLIQVNPSDIESMDILKDASATAIYGSRGANGVIMITTKKGKVNQSVIEINSQLSFSSLPKPFDLIYDPYLYAQLSNESYNNANSDSPGSYTPLYIGKSQYGTYFPSLSEIQNGTWKYKTYWPDVVYRTGVTSNNTVAARGGSENTQYAISLGYMNTKGMVIGNNYDKYTGNFKINQKLLKNLSVGIDSKLTVTDNKKANAVGGESRSPVFPVRDSTGAYFTIGLSDYYNPEAVANEITNKNQTIDLLNTGYVDWEIVKGLTLHSNLSFKYGESLSDYYEPRQYGSTGHLFNGYGSIGNYKGTTVVNDNFLTYKKTFAEKHDLTLMAGTSYESYHERTSNLIGKNFVNDILGNESLSGAAQEELSNSAQQTKLNSYFGRLIYGFADKYLLTFTMRADGSSKFGADNKWGYFPSAAAAWNVDKEAFFPQSSAISSLKFRGSWGITGNQAIPPYQTLDRLGSSQYWLGSGLGFATGYGPGVIYYQDSQSRNYYQGLANTKLKWESTQQIDIGTDIGLFNQRIRITADYYSKKTQDILRLVNVAISSGFDQQYQNSGSMSNKGFELAIDANILHTSDFSWNVGFNMSHNKNEILDYGSTIPQKFGTYLDQFRGNPNYLVKGQPMGVFYGYKADGIVQTKAEGLAAGLTGKMANPGEIKYLNYNGGDGSGMDVLGSPEAKFNYGFNTKLNYKGFDLAIACNGSYGNKIANLQRMNEGSIQFQRWTLDNPNNQYPRLNAGRAVYFSDWWLEDGSFLKIQNITLGYNFSNTEKKVPGVKSIRLYVSCENVATFTKFTGYDPELSPSYINSGYESGTNGLYNGGYPRPRTITCGLNLTF